MVCAPVHVTAKQLHRCASPVHRRAKARAQLGRAVRPGARSDSRVAVVCAPAQTTGPRRLRTRNGAPEGAPSAQEAEPVGPRQLVDGEGARWATCARHGVPSIGSR